jgi:CRP/FNR family transcriptional regulator, cyclic AMP receptor protein
MDLTRLDLRALPVWERPDKISELFDRLPFGGSMIVITDNEPRGLAFRIEQTRPHEVILDHRRTGEREWTIHLTRVAVESDAPSPTGIIKRAAAFSGASVEIQRELAAQASLHTIRRGQTIVTENTEWPYLGIVFEGVLALTTGNGNGRPRIFLEIFPYELFGELELFDEAPASGRVIALSKVARYLRVPRRVVLEAGERYPQLLVALGRANSQRRRDHMQALATQATMPIIARIAHVLVPYAVPERGLSPARAPLPHLTQAQIAAAAGTVKEVAARAIAELEQRALLKRERGHIRYLDRQGLLDMIKDAG